jgi:hypothetical protein
METFILTDARRRQLAKALTKYLYDNHQIELKHTHANAAIAALFGYNEHSLAKALDKEKGTASPKPEKPKCAVANCKNDAVFEVRLYDIYLYLHTGEIFDEQDFTCPYLCASHMLENEEQAEGVREPRGDVTYPYTNKHDAQGFSIYREL